MTVALDTAAAPLLRVRGLQTWYPIRRGVLARTVGNVRAVEEVSFDLAPGETLGLVGESGCGKTTLGRTLLGLEKARAGSVRYRGHELVGRAEKDWRPLRPKIQMVFQDPYASLNPRLTVLDQLTEAPAAHGRLRGPRRSFAAALLAEVGLPEDALDRYPFEFSGGQRQRISLARALALRPEFIVCDEAVSALDVSVQAQTLNLLADLRARHNLAYLFITHDLNVVRHLAHRTAVMYLGRIVEQGVTADVLERPLHPYTQALLAAAPVPGIPRADRRRLRGEPPSPARPPPGCPFHPRCPRALDVCRREWPAARVADGRAVHCHLYADAPVAPED